MRYDNLKIKTQEVQVEFTVKMTEKKLKQLVEILGCTCFEDLVNKGCSESAAEASYMLYCLFNNVSKGVENAV